MSSMAAVAEMEISIHASREGSDDDRAVYNNLPAISIHASREGSDGKLTEDETALRRRFQSTLPAREATVRSSCPLMTAQAGMVSANRDF